MHPSAHAPPPPAISMNMEQFSLLILCLGISAGVRPTSRQAGPGEIPTASPAFTKRPRPFLRQLGDYRNEPTTGRQVSNTGRPSGTAVSIRPSVNTARPASVSVQRPNQSPPSPGYTCDGAGSSGAAEGGKGCRHLSLSCCIVVADHRSIVSRRGCEFLSCSPPLLLWEKTETISRR